MYLYIIKYYFTFNSKLHSHIILHHHRYTHFVYSKYIRMILLLSITLKSMQSTCTLIMNMKEKPLQQLLLIYY